MSKRPTYRIEHYCDIRKKWVLLMTWWGMPRGKADGAFMVLRGLLGGRASYRLCTDDGEVIETHHTGSGPVPT